jgi:hypothetical protein
MLAGYSGASFRGRRDSLGFRVSVGDYHWIEKGEIGRSDRGKHKRKYSRTITVFKNGRSGRDRRFEEYKAGKEESQWAKLNAPRMVNKGVVISTWEA